MTRVCGGDFAIAMCSPRDVAVDRSLAASRFVDRRFVRVGHFACQCRESARDVLGVLQLADGERNLKCCRYVDDQVGTLFWRTQDYFSRVPSFCKRL